MLARIEEGHRLSATATTRNQIKTVCVVCSRPVVLDLGIDLGDPEFEGMALDLISMARRVKCEECHCPRPTMAPSRSAWINRSVPREHDDEV